MNIVFIVHYFPPLNSAGNRRVEAFSKYLSSMGHRVTVLTTVKHSYDGDLSEPVPDFCTVIELGRTGEAVSLKGTSSSRHGVVWALVLMRRVFTRVLGQIIDPRIGFGLRFRRVEELPERARKALQEADVVFSSFPPWPVHLAAYFVVRRMGKPWVCDYRDQFSGSHLFRGNPVSRSVERWLDSKLLARATSVIVVSEPSAVYYSRFHDDVHVIMNGYDPDHFTEPHFSAPKSAPDASVCTIRHLGVIRHERIPTAFLHALSSLSKVERDRLRVEFIGEGGEILRREIENHWPTLAESCVFGASVSHAEAIQLMCSADVLLLAEPRVDEALSTRGVVTSKVFEYLASRRPIIAEVPSGSLMSDVVEESGLALYVGQDAIELGAALQRCASGQLAVTPVAEMIERYSRVSQTGLLAQVLTSAAGRDDRVICDD